MPPSREAATCLLLACRGLGALYAPIADCDEVFNYWEPLHFGVYGTGAQTWEYSPQFALRSWTYILLHALNAVVFRHFYAEPLGGRLQQLGAPAPKIWVFYLTRLSLVAASAVADASLYSAVAQELAPPGPRRPRALAVLVLLSVSCGLVSSSCAFLPSTFAMYLTSAASAALLRLPETRSAQAARKKVDPAPGEGDLDGSGAEPSGSVLPEGAAGHMQTCIGCMVVAVLVGWPFVGLLALPMAYLLVFGVAPAFSLWTLIKTSVLAVLAVAVPMAAVESVLYGRPTMPPVNIVLYNVLGLGGDSTLYGTEAWWFYLANLAINFNVALPLALLLPLLLLVKHVAYRTAPGGGKGDWHLWCWISPLYLWLAFLSAQAHKEERFMFAVYPLLATAAGVCLADGAQVAADVMRSLLGLEHGCAQHTAIARCLVLLVLVLSALISLSRFLTVALYFSAPMAIWPAVGRTLPLYRAAWGILDAPLTVCVGKEWFRFPGHLLVDTSSLASRQVFLCIHTRVHVRAHACMRARTYTHMCVCIYILCTYEFTSVCMLMYMCTCVCACVYVCVYIHTYVCIQVCMYVCMYVCMHACMYACIYVCLYVCMYACMYVCTYVCMYVSNTYIGANTRHRGQHVRRAARWRRRPRGGIWATSSLSLTGNCHRNSDRSLWMPLTWQAPCARGCAPSAIWMPSSTVSTRRWLRGMWTCPSATFSLIEPLRIKKNHTMRPCRSSKSSLNSPSW